MVTKEKVQRTQEVRALALRNANLSVPAPEHLVFYAGIGVMALVGIMEWPVVAVVAIGHVLANSQHNKALQLLGEALEEA